MKENLAKLSNYFGLAYWVKIETEKPSCTYYFGPFTSAVDAKIDQSGYIDDLKQEGAEGITVKIQRCKPTELTVDRDREENLGFNQVSIFGAQS